jgi:hypothetical protein
MKKEILSKEMKITGNSEERNSMDTDNRIEIGENLWMILWSFALRNSQFETQI